MHQLQPLAAGLNAGGEILADEIAVGDVVDDAHRVVAVALERIHQLADAGQERERHVLDPQRGAGASATGAEPVERRIEMSDQLGGVGGKQRVRLARADHHAARAELAGEPHGVVSRSSE